MTLLETKIDGFENWDNFEINFVKLKWVIRDLTKLEEET